MINDYGVNNPRAPQRDSSQQDARRASSVLVPGEPQMEAVAREAGNTDPRADQEY